MKKLLLLCAALALVAAPVHAGGLQLAWTNCPGIAGATPDIAMDCDPLGGNVYLLNGGFTLDASTPGVVAMDGIMDLAFNGQSDVPAFWQFQAGGCNDGAAVMSDGRPTAGCTGYTNTMCGTGGGNCDGVITAYGLNYGGPNRARLLFTLARASTSPVTLAALPTKHFAFQLAFGMDNADPAVCAGCATTVSMAWNMAILYNTTATAGGEGIAAVLSSTDPGSTPSVCANAALCDVVPVKNKTWGQLKSLYR